MIEDSGVEGLRRQQRLIFRCVTGFLLDLVGRQIRRHDGDFTRAVVYMAAIQASRPPSGGDTDIRPFSVRAIAQSMGLPYETTRRKIAELEAAGLARRLGDRGYVVSPATFEGAAYRVDGEATWRTLRRVIIDLRALQFDFDQFAGGSGLAAARHLDPDDLTDAANVLVNDFLLRVLEGGVEPHGSMLDAVIFATMLLANAELLTHDPQLAWTYAGAETPPPDNLRRPATIIGIARPLGLTHETVRRHVRRHRERGWVRRVTGGYLITQDRIQAPDVLQSGLLISHCFLQLMRSLRQLGVDPAAIEAVPGPGRPTA
ncbi:MAG TPA: hypothetical protein PLO65_10830 [Caulobacter sp.]|nr:hypothetical protein [Caulobacter sp.]